MTGSVPKGKPKVLVFDDDPEMLELLADPIRAEGFEVETCSRFRDLAGQVAGKCLDLVVFDAGRLEVSPEALFRTVSACETSPPLLWISDRDLPVGTPLPGGSFSVLRKPFDRKELLGRIRSRIETHPELPGLLRLGPFCLDLRTEDFECDGVAIRLTQSEFRLLQELLIRAGEVLSREQLIQRVQGEGVSVVDRAIDTHVVSLRKKLGLQGAWIETVRGAGYLMRKTPPR